MKRYTTRFLKSIAIFYLFSPLTHIVCIAILFDIPLASCAKILLSPFYHVVSFCCMALGYGLWEMRRWTWPWFIVSQILLVYENAILALSFATSHHKVAAFCLTVLCQAFVYYLIRQEVRVPYFSPRIRWWESDPRYCPSFPVQLTRMEGEVLSGQILDFSPSGCFIQLRVDTRENEVFLLETRIYGYPFQCRGTAVWKAESAVTYPKGVGIKFHELDKNEKKIARSIFKKIRKIDLLYKRYRYWSPDEFLRRIELLERE